MYSFCLIKKVQFVKINKEILAGRINNRVADDVSLHKKLIKLNVLRIFMIYNLNKSDYEFILKSNQTKSFYLRKRFF